MPFRRKKAAAAAAAVFKSGSIAPPFLPFTIELFKILVLQLLRGELKKKIMKRKGETLQRIGAKVDVDYVEVASFLSLLD